MDNAGFEDTEMTEIKVEIPGENEEEEEVFYARMGSKALVLCILHLFLRL